MSTSSRDSSQHNTPTRTESSTWTESSASSSARRYTSDRPKVPDHWRQLRTLYWKDYLISKWKRHYCTSSLELLIPILFLMLVAYLRGYGRQFGGTWVGPHRYRKFTVAASVNFDTNGSEVIYAPATDYTNMTVPSVFESSPSPPVLNGFKTIADLMRYLEGNQSTNVELAILFDPDTANGSQPGLLNYTLRFNDTRYNFHTSKLFAVSPEPRSRNIPIEESEILWPCINALFVNHLKFHGLLTDDNVSISIPKMKFFPTQKYFVPSGPFEPSKVVPFILSLICVLPLLFFASKTIRDKENRMKELLRMMGLPDFIYWLNLFLVGFTTTAVLMVMAWVLFCFPVFGPHMYASSDPSLILIIFMLFAAAEVLQILLITVIFNSAMFGGITILGIFVLSLTSIQKIVMRQNDDSAGVTLMHLSSSIFPVTWFYAIGNIITYREVTNVGVQWTNIAKLASPGDSVSLLAMLIAIVLSCVLYMFLIFYLDAVNPWQPGIPKPLFFLCQSGPCYTLANEESSSSQRFITKYSDVPSYLIEKPPAGTKNPAIEICDVTYRCDNKKVLSNLSLEFYQKEISVLLGHNGAGKTTAMSILAGLLPPTSGKVYINGLNVQKNTTAARRDIGLCPQHNALFDDLTVREHLVFFARIRGANSQNAEKEANESIMQFEFFPQEGVLARNLSAGIKRRLCMANAMIGGSSIVILDEPTTGMDPEVRRRVWTILQEARQDRTILMTTHDMNEADFLGDRIAILANGKLKCTGSPIFLKKAFETGYNLRCMKSGPNTSVKSIVERLQICLDDDQVRLVSEVGLEFTINLGFPNAAEFIKLFRDLETNKDKLGIASWGVSVTTIEDVFLKVDQLGDDLQSFPRKSREQYSQLFPRFTRITGSLLRRRQFYAILLKRSRVIRRQWFMLLVLIVIPGILVIYFARWAQSALDTEDRTEPGLHYSFRSFSQGKRSQGFIQRRQQNFDSNILELKLAMEEDGLKVHELDHDTNVDEFLLDQAISNPLIYKTLWKMGGVSNRVKPMEIALWFNAEPYHVPAIALVRWQTALLRQLMLDFNNPNGQDEVTVDVTNHPFTSEDLKLGNAYFQIYLFFNVFILIQLAVSFMACAMIYIPIEERASKAELLQMMTGVSRSVYFGAVFAFDFLTILLCSGIIATLIALCNPTESIATEVEIGGATCILLCSYGAMMILVSYVCSYMLSTPGTDFAVFLAATVLGGGVIAPILVFAWGGAVGNFMLALNYIEYIPQVALVMGFFNIRKVANSKRYCESFSDAQLSNVCRTPLGSTSCCNLCTSPGSMRKYCYKRESLFVMNATSGVGFQVVALLTEGALVLLVLIAIETGLIRCCLRPFLQFKAFIYRRFFWIPTVPLSEDSDVKAEKHKVLKIITKDNQSHYALVADNLTKTYDGFVAVNHISFAVDHGECFGLLGSNGAGKSTTFRMLTGDLDMSEGNAYICGANLRTSPREYQTNVGFCPQTDALIDKLSVRVALSYHGREASLERAFSTSAGTQGGIQFRRHFRIGF
ncbi:ATP-binding cassette sub-family A member 3-like isoform X5 [Varroa destructor]|uniref:ABC transporter domain-containing protein n=1 Tax=Varroa destructor TaxID=109461 RepID=A0A7M7K553_VARDE|nr:ATP-binding cassette sub-family A member 3-like isoform X5 [Varroa destructor]